MNAVFRCDATVDIGFGHLSRCIALAEALQLFSVRSTFAGVFDVAAAEQISSAGFESISLQSPINTDAAEQDFADRMGKQLADFVVVDSYRADEYYLTELKSLGTPIVVIDDFGTLKAYPCDVVLNFTWEAPSLGYPAGPVLLLGPNYLLARRQLIKLQSRSLERDRRGTVRNLVIAVGGADPKGVTGRLMRALSRGNPQFCLHAIAANEEELVPLLSRFAPGSQILPRLPNLAEPLLWADAAITGGGLLKYECAYMGVPVAAIAQNDGQDGETRILSGAGLVFDLGLADSVTDDELARDMATFISDIVLRSSMISRMAETFVPDPAANAAQAILHAVRG